VRRHTDKHVATPDGRAWVFQGVGPELGVSRSGDVQAAIVAGLLARGAAPDQVAVWAAYIHGRAGERLAAAIGVVGALAREQLDQVPRVRAEIG
jgi:ADP-dependent NAD(P)H-hydrate dehydratase